MKLDDSARLRSLMLMVSVVGLFTCVVNAADTVEFTSGAQLTGTITSIDKAARKITFESRVGGRKKATVYPYSKIHAVDYRGKRYVLTPKSTSPSTSSSTDTKAADDSTERRTRSRAEVESLISQIGSTPPDWLEETPLNYPKSLDLSWPLKPPTKGWNQSKNVGQYLWSVVNENPSRWKSGVKLLHHIIATQHSRNSTLLKRDMGALGEKYFELFQDYPRAAFWLRKSDRTPRQSVMLAECYWQLGNKQMALATMKSSYDVGAIKLLGEMGETSRALQLANGAGKSGRPHEAYLLAGDVLRRSGQLDQAITYYNKVLDAGKARNAEYDRRFKSRARESIEAIELFDKTDPTKLDDGTYTASATGYNGALHVEVAIAKGKIVSVKITKHSEKQFYAALTDTPKKITSKQAVQGIDATSRATITSQAIVNATARALSKGGN